MKKLRESPYLKSLDKNKLSDDSPIGSSKWRKFKQRTDH